MEHTPKSSARYEQSGNIVDYVFPLIKSKRNPNGGYAYHSLIGTGFFIGVRGFAITAGHVIDQLLENHSAETDAIAALFQKHPNWYAFEIEAFEKHPTEDVGIIKITSDQSWNSILRVTDTPQNSACEYDCWGYPHEIAKELKLLEETAPERPELIYTQGYVRRRISRELYPTMIFRGTQFYEVSETVGGGNSGGPLILKTSRNQAKWDVFGVYIGENAKVGYAVRAEAFSEWVPGILGRSVKLESSN
jgi:hypothetical protein